MHKAHNRSLRVLDWGAILGGVIAALMISPAVFGQAQILRLGQQTNEYDMGKIIEKVGDFDADGTPDLLVGSTNLGGSSHDVLLIYNANGNILKTYNLPIGDYLTRAVGMGDVDADGVPDFAYTKNAMGYVNTTMGGVNGNVGPTVSLPPVGAPNPGVLVCVSGATGQELYSITDPDGNVHYGMFGGTLDNIGDINGDNVDDLISSDHAASTPGHSWNGSVYVFSGRDGALIHRVDGTNDYEYFGMSVSKAGDLNADGIRDFLIGRGPDPYMTGVKDAGIVLSGKDASQVAVYALPGTAGFSFGSIFEAVGGEDIDADGVADIVLSRASDQTTAPNSGFIRVISGATGAVIHDIYGQPCEGLGAGISLDDINGDGHADILTGNQTDLPNTSNDASVISGLSGERMVLVSGTYGDVLRVRPVGDVNGDNYLDFAIARYDGVVSYSTEVVVYAGGPSLASSADSRVMSPGGLAENLLRIDNQDGGLAHCVGCGVGQSFTITLGQPAANPLPADFVIFGRLGVPMENESYPVPGVVGDMTMVPAPLATWAIPVLFTMVTSVGDMPGGQILKSGPAPWAYTVAGGIPIPIEFTLEGVVMQDASTAVKTNAVIVRIH